MRRCGLVVVLALAACAAVAARGGEHAGGAEKLRVTARVSPAFLHPPGYFRLDVTAESRPTDAGAGNARNGKEFLLQVAVTLRDPYGNVSTPNERDYVVDYPADLPASEYHPWRATTSASISPRGRATGRTRSPSRRGS